MSDEILFLPYLRRGLAQAITVQDPLQGPLAHNPAVTAWVDIAGQHIERAVQLRSADDAVGLGSAQVLRTEPRPDSIDVEPNYFPFIELAADLPWLLTPAAPNQNRLRPWLVLVVVREQDGVSVETRTNISLPVLRIAAPAAPAQELPDLDDAWAWAHVQSLVPLDEVATAVAIGSRQVFSRLVCPRRLLPGSRYVACLVPAFDGGVQRGLGETPTATQLIPAWQLANLNGVIELPVYYHWRFTTGAAGDFETLCRRLQPDGDGAEMGLHAMDITNPGLVQPAQRTVLLDMEGALKTLEAGARNWPANHKAAFQGELVPLLNAGIGRAEFIPPARGQPYDPATQDPVVAPPTYGVWPAAVTALPADGWLRELNLHPVRRAAAGLGARVVRENQEALVAAAWEQAGEIRATTTALNCGRLAAEIGRSWTKRGSLLADEDLLQFTARLHPLLPFGAQSIRSRLAASAVPPGMVTSAYLRQTRPGTPLARDWARRVGHADARLAAEHLQATLKATDPNRSELQRALSFAVFGLPHGAQVADPTLELPSDSTSLPAAAVVTDKRQTEVEAVPILTVDVSGIAASVRSGLDPLAAVQASIVARIPTLQEFLVEKELPTHITVTPTFDDPLYWDLLNLDATWLLPGVTDLEANRVRLVAVNTAFIGAFLIGANHELARELLWRDYPVDLRGTFFHRFWQYVDQPAGSGAARRDISDLNTWKLHQSLLENMDPAQETMTAIVVRGDLIRRYPTAHWFLQAARRNDAGERLPIKSSHVEVSFLGLLDAQTAVYGFDLRPEEVRSDPVRGTLGYFVTIEEQAGAPRFGLDTEKPRHFTNTPQAWDQLSWGHLVANQPELDRLTHARATGMRIDGLTIAGTTWGKNAAHLAAALSYVNSCRPTNLTYDQATREHPTNRKTQVNQTGANRPRPDRSRPHRPYGSLQSPRSGTAAGAVAGTD